MRIIGSSCLSAIEPHNTPIFVYTATTLVLDLLVGEAIEEVGWNEAVYYLSRHFAEATELFKKEHNINRIPGDVLVLRVALGADADVHILAEVLEELGCMGRVKLLQNSDNSND